jgi:hypothetical protein
MPEITHVGVQIEQRPESPTSFLLVAEAGYPESDEVVSAVEYGPVELDAADPASSLTENDLNALLLALSAALRDEADITISVEDLSSKAIIVHESR